MRRLHRACCKLDGACSMRHATRRVAHAARWMRRARQVLNKAEAASADELDELDELEAVVAALAPCEHAVGRGGTSEFP